MIITAERTLQIDGQLALVPLDQCDVDEYVRLRFANIDHLVAAREASYGTSEAAMRKSVEWMQDDMRAGRALEYGMVRNAQLIGKTGINLCFAEADVDYWLAQDQQGKGVATRAVRAMISYAFAVRDVPSVRFIIRPENVRSRQLAQRVGAQRIATSSEEYAYDIWRLRRGRQ